MKKPAVLLFTTVVLISLLLIPNASAGTVSISFSGERNVKPGQTYTYDYEINMNDACGFFVDIKCINSEITNGDLSPTVDCLPDNTNLNKKGSFNVKIRSAAEPGDIITITAVGRYSVYGSDDVGGEISESYTLTVISSEDPTPSPTAAPTPEPIPIGSEEPTPSPSQEPAVTSTPKASSHSNEKSQTSASPANHSETPSPSPTPSNQPQITVRPTPTPLKEAWSSLNADLDTLAKGGMLTISMDSTDSTLSAFTLNALRAKQGIIIINFSDYSCTIDGKELGAGLTEPVNLSLSMTKTTAVSDAADGHDIYQLHFAEAGDLPGCMKYSFKALENQQGDILYLYQYHAASGLVEYKQCATVDENSCISFKIYEGGSYFATTSHDTVNPNTGEESGVADNSASSDIWMIVVTAVCVICAVAAIFAVWFSKRLLKNRSHHIDS